MQFVELRFFVEILNRVKTTQRPDLNGLALRGIDLDMVNCLYSLGCSERRMEYLTNVFASILNDLVEVALKYDEPVLLDE